MKHYLYLILIVAVAVAQNTCGWTDGTYQYTVYDIFKNKLSDLSSAGEATIPEKSENPVSVDFAKANAYAVTVSQNILKVSLSDLQTSIISIPSGPGYISTLFSDDTHIYAVKTNECEDVTLYKILASDGSIVSTLNRPGFIQLMGLIQDKSVALLYTGACDGSTNRFDQLDLATFTMGNAIDLPVPSYFNGNSIACDTNENDLYCFSQGNVTHYKIENDQIETLESVFVVDNSNGYYIPMIFGFDRTVADVLHMSLRFCASYSCSQATYYQFSLSCAFQSATPIPKTQNDFSMQPPYGLFQRVWDFDNLYLINAWEDRDSNTFCEGVFNTRDSGYITTCLNVGGPTSAPTSAPQTTTVLSETSEATCSPCPCGSIPVASKRRTGSCPVCYSCSTNAPTSSTPTTSSPTYPTDCWTCPSGMVHYWEIEGATADDRCACFPDPKYGAPATTTNAPTPQTTKADGQNISGQNNARSSAAKTVATGSVFLLALAVMASL